MNAENHLTKVENGMNWLDALLAGELPLSDNAAMAEAVDSLPYNRPPDLVVMTHNEHTRATVRGVSERDSLVQNAYRELYEMKLVVIALIAALRKRGGLADVELAEMIGEIRRAVDARYLGYQPGSGEGEPPADDGDNPFADFKP